MACFLDTIVCIYCLKGTYPSIGERMRGISPASIKVPSIVRAELLLGAAKSDRPARTLDVLERFLSPFEVVPFDAPATDAYAGIRSDLEKRGVPIGANDLIVAATVQAWRGTLVTHNVREFHRVRGLPVADWTR